MAATKADKTGPTTKKFGKGERTVHHHTQKARRYYPAEDEAQPKKVCWNLREPLRASMVVLLAEELLQWLQTPSSMTA